MQENVLELCRSFFSKLGVDFSSIELEVEEENIFKIFLKSEDSHLLIGPHGKNLDSLSHMLSLLIGKSLGNRSIVHLEINDYQEQKDKKLLEFISQKISWVRESGKQVILPYFNGYERKKIHGYVSEHGHDVETLSIGEGKNRRIHLSKKINKIDIDIDGNDI